ncbi:hypothetical protein C4D60_Mb02t20520 [Musa balbisiana]|uniref:Clu domain-containing protein n=1 Tax=Musa balbisiana TaxID=52838 RepID=A0A4S8ICZ2_MUSBA|nr:hypothetical protein C4D60_Mb02t20520 [Musa balbisiana]
MAPKGARGKGKGEKKKKDEKVLPLAVDITVKLPDESHVVLKINRVVTLITAAIKIGCSFGCVWSFVSAMENTLQPLVAYLQGISTDRIIDVRRLLCVNTSTCNFTNYSLCHEVRGTRLKDSVDITALKPCTLTLVEEDYDEERALAHVRRLLDLLCSTTCFGPSPPATPPPKDAPPVVAVATKDGKKSGGESGSRKAPPDPQRQAQPPTSPTKDLPADLAAEMSGACPRLGAFYEFFSLANLTPPIQFIRRTTNLRQDERPSDDHIFFLEVKLCNGKLVIVEACARGFYSLGKQRVLCHNLVDLLRHLSRAFDNAYEDLMKAFMERNKFGNLPYGFRANTWLVPPVAAQSPSIFPSLPAEDETWGGNGGGWGRDGKNDMVPWANEFLFLKSMPCKTAEERQIRDRRAFLLHSLFVDVAILRAIAAVKQTMEKKHDALPVGSENILHFETVGDFSITVTKDVSDAKCKVDTKIDGSKTTGIDAKHLVERNLLKGITADENTAAHDVATLGVVNVRYCGYIAVVKVNHHEKSEEHLPLQGVDIKDHPEGGANALNINSLRMLLHKNHTSREKSTYNSLQNSKPEEHSAAQAFVEKLLSDSLVNLEEEKAEYNVSMRWELGACWIQHLQDQNNGEKDKKQAGEKDKKQTGEKTKSETRVEGLGKPLKILKNHKKKPDFDEEKISTVDRKSSDEMPGGMKDVKLPFEEPKVETTAIEDACKLKDLLPEPAYTRLQESKTGLHMKSPQELTEMALRYYDEVALPKLVKLSEKLSHVQSLCIHEMIVRAFKHVVRAVIAAVSDTRDLSISITATLNLLLGLPDSGVSHSSVPVHTLVWRWLEVFLKKRYDWELTVSNYCDIRKYAILRGLCHKATTYQQKALDINERELGLDHPDTMKSYGDLAVFYYRLQHTELALKYVKRALYLLHLTCGPSHPNTAATYINVAMMEEGLGNVHVALRYLHKALKCNQRLLGPDHIQTAASYHAIAIALSLMEAYPLSVQHEQTTLQILRAKLGPDDLRTQDAAAWLEYFESKALEQQEAARNGTRKPDASIASKGHLSVSDLLDYINPIQDGKGRDADSVKKKNLGLKVKVQSSQNLIVADSHATISNRTKNVDTASNTRDDKKTIDPGVEVKHEVVEKQPAVSQQSEGTTEHKLPSDDEDGRDINTEIEDGWQPVQKQRLGGGSSQRIKQRRTSTWKTYNYQMNDVPGETAQSKPRFSYLNNRYYVLKKRTVVPGSFSDNLNMKIQSPGTKFGRRVYRAVTYRVKSVPSSTNQEITDNYRNAAERMASSVDGQAPYLHHDNEVLKDQKYRTGDVSEPYNHLVVGLKNSPSYKDVALAPPGTIAKVQSLKSLEDTPLKQEIYTGKHVSELRDSFVNEKHAENAAELTQISDIAQENDSPQDVVLDLGTKAEIKGEGEGVCELESPLEPLASDLELSSSSSMPIKSSFDNNILCNEVQEVEQNDSHDPNLSENTSDIVTLTLECLTTKQSTEENHEEVLCSNVHVSSYSSIHQEDLQKVDIPEKTCSDDPMVKLPSSDSDIRELPAKKLSASAAPFNPSLPVVINPLPGSVGLPPSGAIPTITPWQLSATLHGAPTAVMPAVPPICTSPHHPFASSSRSPNILHPLRFIYPQYTRPQVMPNTTFAMNSNMFHGNHYPWQCNISPNAPDFVAGPVWPVCHPVDFSSFSPVLSPISESTVESTMTSDVSNGMSLTPLLSINIEEGTKTDENNEKSQVIDTGKSLDEKLSEKQEAEESQSGNTKTTELESETDFREDAQPSGEKYVNESSQKYEGEGSLSIYIKGRSRRKQTLRLPISLLKRPYGSQSFKVTYSKVVRGSDVRPANASSSIDANIRIKCI